VNEEEIGAMINIFYNQYVMKEHLTVADTPATANIARARV
jgi:hypothetical protein